jgi:hypothetical protein
MKSSNIWVAKTTDMQGLALISDKLSIFYQKKLSVSIKGEEDYEFTLARVEKHDGMFIGSMFKYKKEQRIQSFYPTTRAVETEKTKGHPLIADAYFCLIDNFIMVEEKPPHFGHVMIIKIIKRMADEIEMIKDFEFEFINSKLEIDNIFKQITMEKIKYIRFKDIKENQRPEKKSLQLFEDLSIGTKSKSIEFGNPREGLNPNASYIEGGKILAQENKANIKIETETGNGEKKVYDTTEARNKIRERIEYKDETERKFKIIDIFKKLFNKLK